MILYVNGDSHTAAAEAVNPHAFAYDDGALGYMNRLPHPDNLAVSWGRLLATALRAGFHCGAESAASNTRIMRTTREWLSKNLAANQDVLVVIQWSTWEREEWLIDGVYYQVNGSGIDIVPQESQERYRNYVIGLDWEQKTQQAHLQIWMFHEELKRQGIKHIFFNGNNVFPSDGAKFNWGTSYIGPYDPDCTFNNVIRAAGIETVSPKSWHFGPDGHSVWHKYLLDYIITNKII
jgi:hypothetical protein